jgi:rubredoxin
MAHREEVRPPTAHSPIVALARCPMCGDGILELHLDGVTIVEDGVERPCVAIACSGCENVYEVTSPEDVNRLTE